MTAVAKTLTLSKLIDVFDDDVALLNIDCEEIEINQTGFGHTIIIEVTGAAPDLVIKKKVKSKALGTLEITQDYLEEELILFTITKTGKSFKLEGDFACYETIRIEPGVANDCHCHIWVYGNVIDGNTTLDEIGNVENVESVDLVDKVTEVSNVTSLDLVDKVTVVDKVTEVSNVTSLDLVDKVTEVSNVTSLDLVDKVTVVDKVTEVSNVTSLDLVDAVTVVDKVTEVSNVTSLDLVDKVTEVSNVTSLDLVDKVTVVDAITSCTLASTHFDANNYFKSLLNNPLTPTWISPNHGSATFNAGAILDLAAFPTTIKAINHIITHITVENVAHTRTTYENGKNGISIYINADNQITILGAGATPFLNTDVQYNVGIRSIDLAYDLGTNLYRIKEQSPLNSEVISDVIIDTTNVAVGTNYYPSSDGLDMLGYKRISIQGAQVSDCLVTIEVTNDISVTKIWHSITPSFWDDISNSDSYTGFGGAGVVTTFCVDKEIGYHYVRLAIVTYDATNIEEIYMRRLY